MVIIYRGKGAWALYLLGLVLVLTGVLLKEVEPWLAHRQGYSLQGSIGMMRILALMLIVLHALPMLVLSVRARQRGRQPVIESETGRVVQVPVELHSLYGVDVGAWGALSLIGGLLLLFRG